MTKADYSDQQHDFCVHLPELPECAARSEVWFSSGSVRSKRKSACCNFHVEQLFVSKRSTLSDNVGLVDHAEFGLSATSSTWQGGYFEIQLVMRILFLGWTRMTILKTPVMC